MIQEIKVDQICGGLAWSVKKLLTAPSFWNRRNSRTFACRTPSVMMLSAAEISAIIVSRILEYALFSCCFIWTKSHGSVAWGFAHIIKSTRTTRCVESADLFSSLAIARSSSSTRHGAASAAIRETELGDTPDSCYLGNK